MMMKMWNWYQNSLSVHPVKTQAISSAILWGVGDLSAQYITHSAAPKKLLQLSMLNLRSTGTAWLLQVCLDSVLLDQLGTSASLCKLLLAGLCFSVMVGATEGCTLEKIVCIISFYERKRRSSMWRRLMK
ncbi:hypothetical protein GLYMA_05G230802v4 [Glycine max]|uniref:uncharacterized protein isoform X1 n=1 Tax=Glycine max TaxID=3847 RepID=UPI0002952383|nr:uncharacterized protein LOC100784763 isoform X1 [Glycine max]XP_025984383.1 uncharacterized protein LOC100784763 isoform X1 [Glycine max]KAG4391669.1 hypothetical protein GLYMA_05G230802v4 [Glycine max]KAH1135910.1 hypothetical protein GYH30_013554 [Glycine max]|eukprot:XP_006580466.1 uncharacterized protein LOC100784763 isoform X1 [Glycine max]